MLIDSKHGLKRSDEALLQALRENAISHQVVLSKVDRVLFVNKRKPSKQLLQRHAPALHKSAELVRGRLDTIDVDGPKALGEILGCSTTSSVEKGKWLGINNLRWSILAATGLNEARKNLLPNRTDIAKPLDPGPAPTRFEGLQAVAPGP